MYILVCVSAHVYIYVELVGSERKGNREKEGEETEYRQMKHFLSLLGRTHTHTHTQTQTQSKGTI